jgi:hypothetical protein
VRKEKVYISHILSKKEVVIFYIAFFELPIKSLLNPMQVHNHWVYAMEEMAMQTIYHLSQKL